eukprot:364810-Chlamydomonas_euryale.AAC.13
MHTPRVPARTPVVLADGLRIEAAGVPLERVLVLPRVPISCVSTPRVPTPRVPTLCVPTPRVSTPCVSTPCVPILCWPAAHREPPTVVRCLASIPAAKLTSAVVEHRVVGTKWRRHHDAMMPGRRKGGPCGRRDGCAPCRCTSTWPVGCLPLHVPTPLAALCCSKMDLQTIANAEF